MQNIFNWMRTNKLATALIVVLIVIFIGSNSTRLSRRLSVGLGGNMDEMPASAYKSNSLSSSSEFALLSDESVNLDAPASGRMVRRDTNLSFVVLDIQKSVATLLSAAESAGGFMVSSNVNTPEDLSSATVVVRVPSEKLDEVLLAYRAVAKKVVSENVEGVDITDQYSDVQARLAPLLAARTKFEQLFAQSKEVGDSLAVLREIQNVQNQIDQIKGQEKYLLESAKSSRITVYLSTDEYELPYTPHGSWRPKLVFKQAVRSFVIFIRFFGNIAIYILVYGVVLVPLFFAGKWLYRKFLERMNNKQISS